VALASVVVIAALAAAIVLRDPPAEAGPSSPGDRNADERNADHRRPTLDADERPDAPGPDKAETIAVPQARARASADLGPVAGDASRVRAEIRRRLFEDDADSPSSWPSLPSDYIRSGMIRDLGPLVGECMCELHPSEEDVAIALEFHLISAPEIGGVIEAVEPRDGNQAAGPLLDCITESAFSVALPPASSRGSTRVSLGASTRQCDEYLAEAASGETGAEARR
jgi:hypothetical protein